MRTILLSTVFALIYGIAAAEKVPDVIVTPDGRELVSSDYQDAVEIVAQNVSTAGKKTVILQIEIPVKVAPKWRRYYVASFVQKYASTLNRKIGTELDLALMASTPNQKLADKWQSQEIVVPAEFEDLPDEVKPGAAELVHNLRIQSWEYRATTLAQKDYAALREKLGSAE